MSFTGVNRGTAAGAQLPALTAEAALATTRASLATCDAQLLDAHSVLTALVHETDAGRRVPELRAKLDWPQSIAVPAVHAMRAVLERELRSLGHQGIGAADLIAALLTEPELGKWLATLGVDVAACRARLLLQARVHRQLAPFGRMRTSEPVRDGSFRGAEDIVHALVVELIKLGRNSAILVGASGVGKSSAVLELARRLRVGDARVPARLRDVELFELSSTSLRAGTALMGSYESRLQELLSALEMAPHVVLFIDELHELLADDGPRAHENQAFKKAIADGSMRVIGCTTDREYERYMRDPAFVRRFSLIRMPPPDTLITEQILSARRDAFTQHYGLANIDLALLPRIVALTDQHQLDAQQPDKALELLDATCAEAVARVPPLSEPTEALAIEVLERRVGHITRPDALTQQAVSAQLQARVAGQTRVLEQVTRKFVAAFSDLNAHRGPRGVLVFAGPTGVGKTETALLLAELLGGSRSALLRVDVNTLAGGPGVARNVLFGPAPGFVGYETNSGGLLSRIRRQPQSVVLFDEFDKGTGADGHNAVGHLLLQLLSAGIVDHPDGSTLDFRRAFIVFTTNAGVRYRAHGGFGFCAMPRAGDGPRFDKQMFDHEMLAAGLGPEFLARIEPHLCVFEPLQPDAVREIVIRQLERLREVVAARAVEMTWSEALLERLTGLWHESYGVRHLLTILQNRVSEQLGLAEAAGSLRDVRRICIEAADAAESGPGGAGRYDVAGDCLTLWVQ